MQIRLSVPKVIWIDKDLASSGHQVTVTIKHLLNSTPSSDTILYPLSLPSPPNPSQLLYSQRKPFTTTVQLDKNEAVKQQSAELNIYSNGTLVGIVTVADLSGLFEEPSSRPTNGFLPILAVGTNTKIGEANVLISTVPEKDKVGSETAVIKGTASENNQQVTKLLERAKQLRDSINRALLLDDYDDEGDDDGIKEDRVFIPNDDDDDDSDDSEAMIYNHNSNFDLESLPSEVSWTEELLIDTLNKQHSHDHREHTTVDAALDRLEGSMLKTSDRDKDAQLLFKLGRVEGVLFDFSALQLSTAADSNTLFSIEAFIPGLTEGTLTPFKPIGKATDFTLFVPFTFSATDFIWKRWTAGGYLILQLTLANADWNESICGVCGLKCSQLIGDKDEFSVKFDMPIYRLDKNIFVDSFWCGLADLTGKEELGKICGAVKLVFDDTLKKSFVTKEVLTVAESNGKATDLKNVKMGNVYAFVNISQLSNLSNVNQGQIYLQPKVSNIILQSKPVKVEMPDCVSINFQFNLSLSTLTLTAPLIVEVWQDNTLIGLIRLPLHLTDVGGQLPVNIPETDYCIVDPLSSTVRGWALCSVSIGSPSDLSKIESRSAQTSNLNLDDDDYKENNVKSVKQNDVKKSLESVKTDVKESVKDVKDEITKSVKIDVKEETEDVKIIELQITVERALHLTSNATDSFVKLLWPFDSSRSEVIGPTVTGVNWAFETVLTLPAKQLNRLRLDRLGLQVIASANQPIGETFIDLSPLLFGMPLLDGWYRLMDPMDSRQSAGEIKVSIRPLQRILLGNTQDHVLHMNNKQPHLDDVTADLELRKSIAVLEQINVRLQQKLKTSIIEKRFISSITRDATQDTREVVHNHAVNNEGALCLDDLMDDDEEEESNEDYNKNAPLFGGFTAAAAEETPSQSPSQSHLPTLAANSANASQMYSPSNANFAKSAAALSRGPSQLTDQESQRIRRIFSERYPIPPAFDDKSNDNDNE